MRGGRGLGRQRGGLGGRLLGGRGSAACFCNRPKELLERGRVEHIKSESEIQERGGCHHGEDKGGGDSAVLLAECPKLQPKTALEAPERD